MDTKVKDLVTSAMEKIHEMGDANTIMGAPVKVDGGITIIPVSKVSYGFASGGSELPNKAEKDLFGGGSGGGITVTPLGFLVISNGEVQLLQMNLDVSTSSAIVNMVPDLFNKVSGLIKKDKNKKGGDSKDDDSKNGDTDEIELPESMLENGGSSDFKD